MTELKNIPKTEHYAVLRNNVRTIHHEGDERSRTNPGHGYPAYTETITSIDYLVFETKEELDNYLRFHHNDVIKVIYAQPLEIKITVETNRGIV
jgi:hypothetical protein